ncbi:transposase [Streptosporangium sp. NBC_01755]|uniref:hypothetical protein n=1 Tax=unclassified Streptosporangium TaxID=2632669 RepID=UPI002DD9AE10|nr:MULTISPECIES: hypothetical protein [unclassified Streptosporangium]WSA28501.1 transposase [Streptosporangium sp. NBC_01810]WSD00012.1 transposase [Streptosporangium sp. NBC_01755]
MPASLAAHGVTTGGDVGGDASVERVEAGGLGIGPENRSRLSPLLFEHINFHGFYPFNRPDLGWRAPRAARPQRRRRTGVVHLGETCQGLGETASPAGAWNAGKGEL